MAITLLPPKGDFTDADTTQGELKAALDQLIDYLTERTNAAADTGVVNAYVLTLSPAITSYEARQRFTFTTVNANTSTSTLAVNGLSATAIKLPDGSALPAGAIPAGVAEVVHNGTDFTLVSASGVVSGDATINSMPLIAFEFQVRNNGGVIEHRMVQLGRNNAVTVSTYLPQISGETASWTATPTVDGVTEFAAGAGIRSGSSEQMIFDSFASVSTVTWFASSGKSSVGTAVDMKAWNSASFDVNGTTLDRLGAGFSNALTGAAFGITTGNIATGKQMDFTVFGFAPDS